MEKKKKIGRKKQAASTKADAWDKNTEREPCQRPGTGCGTQLRASSQPFTGLGSSWVSCPPPSRLWEGPKNVPWGCGAVLSPPLLCARSPSPVVFGAAVPTLVGLRARGEGWFLALLLGLSSCFFCRNCRGRCTFRAGGGGQLPRGAEDPPGSLPAPVGEGFLLPAIVVGAEGSPHPPRLPFLVIFLPVPTPAPASGSLPALQLTLSPRHLPPQPLGDGARPGPPGSPCADVAGSVRSETAPWCWLGPPQASCVSPPLCFRHRPASRGLPAAGAVLWVF